MVLAVDIGQISGGQILLLVSVLTAVYALPKRIARDSVEQWRGLSEGYKAERDAAREDITELTHDVESLKASENVLRVSLARCEEQPKTEELAQAITSMQEGFTEANRIQNEAFTRHRDDLLHTQNRILAHLETTTEAMKSLEQTMTIVAERLK